ncbi:MAG: adenine phosphoribosyltransferase [Bacteroidota bacterium]|nr:adenine phosphoribosyltransferase [Bacteroidota bacterium]MDE2955599.1 adenine phosphoribosyltransferase [Bacteroidota bacterium]
MTAVQRLRSALREIPDFPKPGVMFQDITPIMGNSELLHDAIMVLAKPYRNLGITKVVGVESRGFILGPQLALHLEAGFVPVRKQGKLPYETFAVEYNLEYGKDIIEMHIDAVKPSDRVLIHDDVLATGGTASATERLVTRSGADIAGFSFLVEIGALQGSRALSGHIPFHAAITT